MITKKQFGRINLTTFSDRDFNLTPIEFKDIVPFEVKRIYYIDNIKLGDEIGGHCHKIEEELFVIIKGSITAIIDAGRGKENIRLCGTTDAIYVPNYVWHGFKDASTDCVILALSSTNYKPTREDYIEDYNEHLQIRNYRLNI